MDEYLISYVNELTVTAQNICNKERSSFSLCVQFHITWMAFRSCTSHLQPYCSHKHELSVDQGCMLWGLRVVIPEV